MVRLRQLIFSSVALLVAGSTSLANPVSLAGDEGVSNLHWKSGPIKVAVSSSLLRDGPNIKLGSDVLGALRRSLEAWSKVADIEFVQGTSDKLNVSPSGPTGDGISLITIAPTAENVLLFAKDPANAAASTRIFYGRRGEISEADIVLNPYQQFSTDGTFGTFDLESTLTHEIGHLLGLDHSSILGSTMNGSFGRNGIFGLPSFTSRTLSSADIAAVRAIYGNKQDDGECCGAVQGQLAPVSKTFRGGIVWIEDTAGRVQGSAPVAADGKFLIGGINAGKYRLLAQETGDGRRGIAAQAIGEVVVASGETTEVSARVRPVARDFFASYFGFNGQLSETAVSLSSGRTYTVYVGGRNLDPKKLAVSFSSPHITPLPETLRSLDYGPEVSVISFDVRLAPQIQKGEYTLFLTSPNGDRRALPGGLTVDIFANPWAVFTHSDD